MGLGRERGEIGRLYLGAGPADNAEASRFLGPNNAQMAAKCGYGGEPG
jgi:hypothetical protein